MSQAFIFIIFALARTQHSNPTCSPTGSSRGTKSTPLAMARRTRRTEPDHSRNACKTSVQFHDTLLALLANPRPGPARISGTRARHLFASPPKHLQPTTLARIDDEPTDGIDHHYTWRPGQAPRKAAHPSVQESHSTLSSMAPDLLVSWTHTSEGLSNVRQSVLYIRFAVSSCCKYPK